jgi:hypothetical protein
MLGIPLLFWRRYPKLSLGYCIYSIAFIIVNQVSHFTIDECIFTTLTGWLYSKAGQTAPDEWFTVRISRFIFGLAPTHWWINIVTEVLVAITAMGQIYTFYKSRKEKDNA